MFAVLHHDKSLLIGVDELSSENHTLPPAMKLHYGEFLRFRGEKTAVRGVVGSPRTLPQARSDGGALIVP
jgi:hypothetical protein